RYIITTFVRYRAASPDILTLSLHDALPISSCDVKHVKRHMLEAQQTLSQYMLNQSVVPRDSWSSLHRPECAHQTISVKAIVYIQLRLLAQDEALVPKVWLSEFL